MGWKEVSRRTKKEVTEIFQVSDTRLSFEGNRKCVGERFIPRQVTGGLIKRLSALRDKFPALDLVLEEKRYIGSGGKPFDCHLLTVTGADVDQVKICLNLAINPHFRSGIFTDLIEIPEESRKFIATFLPDAERLSGTKLRLVKGGLEISADDKDAVEDAVLCIQTRLEYFDKFIEPVGYEKSFHTMETCSASGISVALSSSPI